jgi:hypothetical protein
MALELIAKPIMVKTQAKVETGRNLRVAQALGDEVEDLAFPDGKLGERSCEHGALKL